MPQARTAAAKPALTSYEEGRAIVHPGFGVVTVVGVERKVVAGFPLDTLALSVPGQNANIFVPIPKVAAVGLRDVSTVAEVDAALALAGGKPKASKGVWSRKAMDTEAKIATGTLVAWAEVMRDMYRPEGDPEPSYSQRQLYEAARDRLAGEYAAAHGITIGEAMHAVAKAAYLPKGGAQAARAADADEEDEGAEAA